MYLADKFSAKNLAPKIDDAVSRAEYFQWLYFSCNTAEDFFSRFSKIPKMDEEDTKNWAPYIREKTRLVLAAVEAQLQGKEYILGNFSAVDPCLGYALDMVAEESFFAEYPEVVRYYRRLGERPACRKSEIFRRSDG